MIVLILSACLISDPGVCRDRTIPLASEPSTMHCVMTAPPRLAQWSEEHPAWRVTRWRCRAPSEHDI